MVFPQRKQAATQPQNIDSDIVSWPPTVCSVDIASFFRDRLLSYRASYACNPLYGYFSLDLLISLVLSPDNKLYFLNLGFVYSQSVQFPTLASQIATFA